MREPDRLPLVKERFPNLDHVWLAAALSVVVVRALAWPIIPSDFWWQLAYGRWIVEHGSIPAVDHFSYTRAGEPYFDQPWLAQILMYTIYRIGGAALSLIGLAVLLGAAYVILLRVCIRIGGSIRVSAGLLMLSLPVAMTNWSMRSQTFALPLFVLYVALLDDWRAAARQQGESAGKPRHRLWLLPILMVLWVNLHGSFVLGGALIGLVLAGELCCLAIGRRKSELAEVGDAAPVAATIGKVRDLKPLFLWGAVTAAAVLLNPRGPGVVEYVFGLVAHPAIQGIVEEWQAPRLSSLVGGVFFAYAVIVGLAAAFARRRPDPVDLLVLAAFFFLALGAERHVIWFALASLPFLVRQAASFASGEATEGSSRQGRWPVNVAFLGALALAVILVLPPVKPHLSLPPDVRPLISVDTPVASVEFMREDPRRPARLFHTETTGSYLMWAAPEQKVFVDARVQLYPVDQLDDYARLSAGVDVEALLDRYTIDGLLLDDERQAALLEWALRNPEWEVRFEEACCTYLLQRSDAE